MTHRRIRPFDVFMTVNAGAFAYSAVSTWWTSEWEFGLYAAVLLTAGALGWRYVRRFDFPIWLLLLVQLGIVAHFAGGYVKYGEEGWLYWHHFLGVRYDKIVHFYVSLVAVLVVDRVFAEAGLGLRPFGPLVLVGVVTGLGAAIEIVEYFATLTIDNVGVGDYANNMEDLIMNLLGALAGLPIAHAMARARRRNPSASPS